MTGFYEAHKMLLMLYCKHLICNTNESIQTCMLPYVLSDPWPPIFMLHLLFGKLKHHLWSCNLYYIHHKCNCGHCKILLLLKYVIDSISSCSCRQYLLLMLSILSNAELVIDKHTWFT